MVNGHTSKFFQLGSGVRLGDPLSPSLFVLFLEPYLAYLRATTGHLGIPVQGSSMPQHLSAFADDCTGFLKDLRDTPAFMAKVKVYSQAAGLRLNEFKTQLFAFQSPSQDLVASLATLPSSYSQVNSTVTFLGVKQY